MRVYDEALWVLEKFTKKHNVKHVCANNTPCVKLTMVSSVVILWAMAAQQIMANFNMLKLLHNKMKGCELKLFIHLRMYIHMCACA